MSAKQVELERIFHAAREVRDPAARRAYLREACAGDAEGLRQVESLLQADAAAGSFMELEGGAGESGRADRPTSGGVGTVIGRYKLIQAIGEGGFGTVYLAEQREPVQRRVALKIIKRGMDSRQVVARFEAERQALAMMDHPNIARVLDGGTTEHGLPYFVMELVKGIPLTDYCDERRFAIRERLDLFIQICRAVQHAHQKGIIHRDLKPSNILVTEMDGKPVPKVIDFGLAKALQGGQTLTEHTLYTAFGAIAGTPLYMAPEQVGINTLDVDTRTDIYSLGVNLYELLTGTTPLERGRLKQASWEEIRRMIREEDPPKPSTRLGAMSSGMLRRSGAAAPAIAESIPAAGGRAATHRKDDDSSIGFGRSSLFEIARHRHTEPAHLSRLLQGDLDWIVLKALEKDRSRRYETSNALARDIERYLAEEPVEACPPSTRYRFRKFVRRHRTSVLAGTFTTAALLIGISASTWMFFRERDARARAVAAEQVQGRLLAQAEDEKQKAGTEAAKSRQVAQFLKDMLKGVGPSVALGRDTTMLREIMDETLRRISGDLKDQPEVEIELRLTLAQVYFDLQLHQKMEETARETLRLARARSGEQNLAAADALGQIGRALMFLRKTDEAERFTREAIAMQRKLRGPDSLEEASALANLGDVLRHRAQSPQVADGGSMLSEAEAACRASVSIYNHRLGHDNDDTAWALHALAIVLGTEGKAAEGEAAIRESAEIHRKIHGEDHPFTAAAYQHLGGIIPLDSPPRIAEADGYLRKALEIQERIEGRGKLNQVHSHAALARILAKQGRPNEAEAEGREALAIVSKVMGSDYPDLPQFMADLANILRQNGKLAEARPLAEEAVEICIRQPDRVDRWMQERAFDALRGVLTQLGAGAALESAAAQVLQSMRSTLPANNPLLLRAQFNLASILRQNGKPAEASQLCLQAAETCHERLPHYEKLVADRSHHQDCWDFAITYEQLAQLLNEIGRKQEAERAYRDAQTIWIPLAAAFNIEDDRWHLAANHDALGHLLRDSGRLDEAAGSYQMALAIWVKLASETTNVDRHIHLSWTRMALADLLRKQGEPAKAQALLRDAEAGCREAMAICQQRPQEVDAWMQNGAFDALNGVLTALGDTSTLQAAATQAVQNLRARQPADAGFLAVALANLANILRQNGNLAEARPLAEEAVTICQRGPERVDAWMRDRAFDALRQVLTQLGNRAAADALAERSARLSR